LPAQTFTVIVVLVEVPQVRVGGSSRGATVGVGDAGGGVGRPANADVVSTASVSAMIGVNIYLHFILCLFLALSGGALPEGWSKTELLFVMRAAAIAIARGFANWKKWCFHFTAILRKLGGEVSVCLRD
jgi:hypothetical protein